MKGPEEAPTKLTDVLPNIQDLPPTSRHRYGLWVAAMADGTSLHLPVNILAGQGPGPCLLLVAGVHGDEYEGITAQLELWDELIPQDISGTVIMVPVANPPAFRHRARRNSEDMLDMNRIFPGKAEGTITEQLAFCLFHEVALRAEMVLSMHSWTKESLVLPYCEYPRDCPVTTQSRAAAVAFGTPYIEAFDWLPGLLVAACVRSGIPAIEPEIGGLGCTTPERRGLYKRGARNLMRHIGMLPVSSEINDTESPKVVEVTRQELYAPVGGILCRSVELGQAVRPGVPLAKICDLNGLLLAELTSPIEGFVAAQMHAAAVNPGDLVTVVFSLKQP